MKNVVGAYFLIFLFSLNSWAWPPTYGAEFEVTRAGGFPEYDFNNNNPTASEEKAEQLKLVEQIKKQCLAAKCTVTEVKGKWDTDFEVKFSDGWWFKVSYDPDCVEIITKPSTRKEFESHASIINNHIFGAAKKIGLTVNKFEDSAHFNIGVRSAFNDDAKKFLKFFVDYTNRPDLALSSLGYDLANAPPLSMLQESQRLALQKIVEKVNSGKMNTIQQVAKAIQEQVYIHTYESSWGTSAKAIAHYQAIGLKYINRTDLTKADAPMELRSIWTQDSAENFILISKLMEARIDYLNSSDEPIIYTQTVRQEFTDSEHRTRFRIYVEEMGLNYQDFESLLPQEIRQAEFDDFIKKDVSIEKQINGIEPYLDLVLVSRFVRARVIKILSHPALNNNTKKTEIIEKIKVEVAKAQEKMNENKIKAWFKSLFSEPIQTTLSSEAVSSYEKLFTQITKRTSSNSNSISNRPLRCQDIF